MELTVTRGLPAGGRQIRLEVFVREQGFTEASEFDDVDPGAWHAVIWENGLPLATGRLFPDSARELGYIIGRIAVRQEHRGTRLGAQVMEALEEKARSLGAREIHLCAQVRAKGFYESLGYAAYGETVYDESVPHTMMQKRL